MNTAEHIVETYYRIARKCFTVSDIKILQGNNRQIDILAFQPSDKKYYHIEVAVTHCENWCPSLEEIQDKIGYKFFGKARNSRPENPKTDFAKGKSYVEQIKKTYHLYGVDFNKVIRVWCSWYFEAENRQIMKLKENLANSYTLKSSNFELLSFRDTVIPELSDAIGTSNYDDEILRTLSLLNQYRIQKDYKKR
jgi:hypothetical protein